MTQETPPSRVKRAVGWCAAVSDVLTPARIGILLAAALLGVVALFGGWGSVTDAAEDTAIVQAGDEIDAAPFTITVTRARVFDELLPGLPAEDGMRYVAVLMDVTNTTDLPVAGGVLDASAVIDLPGQATIALDSGPVNQEPSVLRTADSLTERTF
ncbi:MAG: hypothetical protein QM607_05375, partial [Microbacterium sp.]